MAGSASGPIGFLVSDDDHLSPALVVTASSDDQVLVPDANLVAAGTFSSRSITVTPAAGETGTATITVTVTDPDGLFSSTSFQVSVTALSGTVSGTVTTGGGSTPLDGLLVAAFEDGDGFTPTAYGFTAGDGSYTVSGLTPGTYRVVFFPLSTTGLRLSWYSSSGGTESRDTATALAVVSDTTALVGIDGDLATAATISGVVTDANTNPAAGITVTVTDPTGLSASASFVVTVTAAAGSISGTVTADGTSLPLPGIKVRLYQGTAGIATVTTDTNGNYTLPGLAPGTDYRLRFADPTGAHATEYNGGGTKFKAAPTITVTTGATTEADASLGALNTLGAVRGIVTADVGGTPLAGITISVYRNDVLVTGTVTSAVGTFELTGLDPTGTWKIRYRDATKTYKAEFWQNQAGLTAATPITLTPGVADNHDAALALR